MRGGAFVTLAWFHPLGLPHWVTFAPLGLPHWVHPNPLGTCAPLGDCDTSDWRATDPLGHMVQLDPMGFESLELPGMAGFAEKGEGEGRANWGYGYVGITKPVKIFCKVKTQWVTCTSVTQNPPLVIDSASLWNKQTTRP